MKTVSYPGAPEDFTPRCHSCGGLKPAGTVTDEALRRELRAFARSRLGPAIAPREIEFIDTLPRNRAGKIQRRALREAQ